MSSSGRLSFLFSKTIGFLLRFFYIYIALNQEELVQQSYSEQSTGPQAKNGVAVNFKGF